MNTVIFDLDGTLIDTEKHFRVIWPKALAHFGYTMTDEQALAVRSLGRPYSIAQFKEWFGEDYDYYKVREYRKQLMEDLLSEKGIELKPGAKEILIFLREKGITVALATANDRERATRYLKKIGLFEYFDKIICADMVERGKPSPDIYSYACKELGESPENCYAVEDSPNGVKSAHSAGCKVIYIPDQSPMDDSLEPIVYCCKNKLMDICELFKPDLTSF